MLDTEDVSGYSAKLLLARVERFEGVLKWANSNKNVMANV